jgi:hypothetical protein
VYGHGGKAQQGMEGGPCVCMAHGERIQEGMRVVYKSLEVFLTSSGFSHRSFKACFDVS